MRTIHAIAAALLLVTGTTVGVLAQEDPGPQPDLVPVDVATSPEDPIEGESTVFTATIANEGEADAPSSFNVAFLVDGEQVGENKTVESLRFGDEAEIDSDAWTATPGEHQVTVIADAHEEVDESQEANNELMVAFEVNAAKVDLVVTELSTTPEEPYEGRNVTLSATVENEGNVASNNTTLRFFVDGSALGPDVDVPGLEPGEDAIVTSGEAWSAAEGEHTISAFVDPGHEQDEADETNNERREDLTVEPDDANLRVDEITVDPEEPEPGQDTTFTANVTNDGHSSAENATVRFLVDGEELSNATIESLGAGESTELTSEAWNGSEGEHTVRVEVDVDDQVTESDEDDNTAEQTFAVATSEEDEQDEDDGEDAGEGDEADEREDAEEGEQTITICHIPPGNPDARHTKEIGEPAWQAHKGHGDHEGPCEESASADDGEDGEDAASTSDAEQAENEDVEDAADDADDEDEADDKDDEADADD